MTKAALHSAGWVLVGMMLMGLIVRELMDNIGMAIDAIGVLVIVVGAILATGRFLFRRSAGAGQPYRLFQQDLGRAILLGGTHFGS